MAESSPRGAALVTGGAGDIGLAIAAALAGEGWRIGLVDLGEAALEKAAAAMPGAETFACDVAREDSVEMMVEAAEARLGPVGLLVNNAGIGRFGPLAELSVADFRAVVEVNLVGAYICARAVARRMIPRAHGLIINITSINAVTAGPGAGAYPAAKAGLAQLTEQMAIEWGPAGLRVNAVAPGFIDGGMSTPFYADPAIRALRGGAVPSRRLGTTEDIARAVAFLASDSASYINGHQLVVDGGVCVSLLAQLPREPKREG